MRVHYRRLTDQEWQTIHAASGAPPEARGEIEALALGYLASDLIKFSKPHEVKSLLAEFALKAEDLLQAYMAVMRDRVARDSLGAFCDGGQQTLRAAYVLLHDIAEAAEQSLEEHQRGSRGEEGNVKLHLLVSGLAKMWEAFSGKAFSGASRHRPNAREFAIATCKIINSSLADNTIDRVVRILVAERRKKSRIDPP